MVEALKALQSRLDILEKEKQESHQKISSLEQELMNARHLLFHKQVHHQPEKLEKVEKWETGMFFFLLPCKTKKR